MARICKRCLRRTNRRKVEAIDTRARINVCLPGTNDSPVGANDPSVGANDLLPGTTDPTLGTDDDERFFQSAFVRVLLKEV